MTITALDELNVELLAASSQFLQMCQYGGNKVTRNKYDTNKCTCTGSKTQMFK